MLFFKLEHENVREIARHHSLRHILNLFALFIRPILVNNMNLYLFNLRPASPLEYESRLLQRM